MLLCVFATVAQAQSVLPEHLHAPVEVDPGMGWNELIAATVAAHPRQFELAALDSTAAAWRARGRQWFSATPYGTFSYLSDHIGNDRNQAEYYSGLNLPLWRIGQRDTAQELGRSSAVQSTASELALRWEVAGLLRNLLWDIAAAGNAVNLAHEALSVADELVRGIERRHAVGDLAEADVLLARTTLHEKSLALIDSEAVLLDAERTYVNFTELDRRPALFAEVLEMHEEPGEEAADHGPSFDDSHPLLALANAEVERARAAADFAQLSTRGNPMLMIGPRRQRDALTDFYNDSLSVGVTVPFGSKRYGATTRAASVSALAAAETRRAQLLRQLDLDLHEAEHTLYVLEQSLAVAEARNEDAARQWRMGRSAFAQGEIELRELLRIQDTAQNAERELERLGIERQRAIAAVNQAIGVLP
ncbi:MAG: TolC family protein [Gammaproteobacteria bacterium]|nr:TolC family protein [Gammaproteobacteria bacterium]